MEEDLFTILTLKRRNKLKRLLLIWGLLICCSTVFAQGMGAQQEEKTPLQQAREYAMRNEYDKAIDIFKQLYQQNSTDATIYNDYLNTLIVAKKYKDAERLIEDQQAIRPRYPLPYIDMGRLYLVQGKDKKADEQFQLAIQYMNGDDMLTQQIGAALIALGRDQYAILAYERGKDLIGNPFVYAGALSKLYAKTGNMEKAIAILMESGNIQFGGIDNTKATLLELLGNDPKKLQLAQKALIKKINEQPENISYVDLLTWLYTQKNDWEGALIQMEALDERNKEQGRKLIDFGRMATKEKKYDIAIKAYAEVTAKGKDLQFYTLAESEKLATEMSLLESNYAYKQEDVTTLIKEYETFLNDFPNYYGLETVADYAILEAQYNNNPQKGIDILTRAIATPGARRDFVGRIKLQLGDYYILTGKDWDASLIYSQVDKEFKQDMLGEEARFRNAKLSYYHGDFEWAQGQLTVLKASTSELIANDALYLSVLITENIGPDSNYVPIKRFAYADLLLFQNKDKEAETLLDSITTAFPKHPLKDDILMLKAKLAEKHREYDKALTYLKEIYEQFGKDVLADDAVFKIAGIYEKHLRQYDQAKHFYEQLIIDYPGSTYVQEARKRLQEINGQSTLP